MLLLNSLGSILDVEKIQTESMLTLLEGLSKINIDVIVLETHYSTINNSILSFKKIFIQERNSNRDWFRK